MIKASDGTEEGGGNWRIYEMDDCDWWLARSPQEARTSYAEYYGSDAELEGEPRELTRAEMRKLQYHSEGNRNGDSHSFFHELKRRLKTSTKPQMFATTEF